MIDINGQAILMNLPSKVKGFSVLNEDATYSVVVNSKLSPEAQRSTFNHEIEHIMKEDFDKYSVNTIEYYAHNLLRQHEGGNTNCP